MRCYASQVYKLSIVYDPAKLLRKIAPERKVKKLISAKASLKKTALSFIDDIDFLNKKKITDVALKTIKGYRERVARVASEQGSRAAGADERRDIVDDPKQLIQRVQNEIIFQVHQGIKKNYGGRSARWLPSSADEPRPEHQLNYGKEYVIGEGIDGVEPGDEYGCQCGVEIIGPETQLELTED